MERSSSVSLQLFAFSLAAWTAGSVFFVGQDWVKLLGAAFIFITALLVWVVFDRLVCGAWLARHRKIDVPIILR
jgi:hypothetical protein